MGECIAMKPRKIMKRKVTPKHENEKLRAEECEWQDLVGKTKRQIRRRQDIFGVLEVCVSTKTQRNVH